MSEISNGGDNSRPQPIKYYGLSTEEFVQVKNRMMKNLKKSYLDVIYDYLDLTGIRPWCGRTCVKWLLSLEYQHILANVACYIVNIYPIVDGDFNELYFEEALKGFICDGIRETGCSLVINKVYKYVIYILLVYYVGYPTYKAIGEYANPTYKGNR